MDEKNRTYKTIKNLLNAQIKNGNRGLWTWANDNFTMIYRHFNSKDRIYTPTQLLKEIDNKIKENGETK